MNGEIDLNTALHQKMMNEQEKYRNWLITKSPERILKHAYMYAMREDILLSLEYWDLSENQARVLLELKNPLSAIYNHFENSESEHMDEVQRAIERVADKLLNTRWPYPKFEPLHLVINPSISYFGVDITLTDHTNALVADSGAGKSYLTEILEKYSKSNKLHSPNGVYVVRTEEDLKELRYRKFDIIIVDHYPFIDQSVRKMQEDFDRIKQAKHIIFMSHVNFDWHRFDWSCGYLKMEVNTEKRMIYVKNRREK